MASPWDGTCQVPCMDPPSWSKSRRRELSLSELFSDLHTITTPQSFPLSTHNMLTNTINKSHNDCNMFTLNVGERPGRMVNDFYSLSQWAGNN